MTKNRRESSTNAIKKVDRRTYERPAVTWEEDFDRDAMLAAACGKVSPPQGSSCAASVGPS